MITETIEIARPPEEVFAYLDQLDRHGEWQGAIVETRVETEGPTRVGTRAMDVLTCLRRSRTLADPFSTEATAC